MIWFWLAATVMVATGLCHSILGERRLIGPLLALDVDLMRKPLARRVLRYAWHFTTILMGLSAGTVLWPGAPLSLVLAVGVVWCGVGLLDGLLTRGEHVGWPLLTLAGGLTVAGAMLGAGA